MDKKKMDKMSERILNHALQIIYLLTGEEYTIVKKNSPNSSIHQLTGKVNKYDDVCFSMEVCEFIEGHKELYKDMMVDNHQTLNTLEGSAHRRSGHSENIITVSIGEEGEDEREDKDVEQLEVHSESSADGVNSAEETEDLCAMSQLEAPEQEDCDSISTGLHDENLYTEEYERDEKVIHHLKILSDPCAGHSNVQPSFLSKTEQEEKLNTSDQQPVKEEEIPINIGDDPHDDVEERKEIQHLEIDPDPCAGPSDMKPSFHSKLEDEEDFDLRSHQLVKEEEYPINIIEYDSVCMNTAGQNLSSDEGVNNIYNDIITFKTSSKNSSKSVITNLAKAFACNDCGKYFSQKYNLVRHQRIHTGEKPFACSQCGKCFHEKCQLVIHQRVHTGEKPFACSQCGKRFCEKYKLDRHQKIHMGEKPFACSECDKCFSSTSGLFKHQRIHAGEKPFACLECGKCFSQKTTLIVHQRVHTGEKPYACSKCGKCFSQKTGLINHEIIHTREKQSACSE